MRTFKICMLIAAVSTLGACSNEGGTDEAIRNGEASSPPQVRPAQSQDNQKAVFHTSDRTARVGMTMEIGSEFEYDQLCPGYSGSVPDMKTHRAEVAQSKLYDRHEVFDVEPTLAIAVTAEDMAEPNYIVFGYGELGQQPWEIRTQDMQKRGCVGYDAELRFSREQVQSMPAFENGGIEFYFYAELFDETGMQLSSVEGSMRIEGVMNEYDQNESGVVTLSNVAGYLSSANPAILGQLIQVNYLGSVRTDDSLCLVVEHQVDGAFVFVQNVPFTNSDGSMVARFVPQYLGINSVQINIKDGCDGEYLKQVEDSQVDFPVVSG